MLILIEGNLFIIQLSNIILFQFMLKSNILKSLKTSLLDFKT